MLAAPGVVAAVRAFLEAQGPVTDLDGVGATGHLDDRHRGVGCAEMPCETGGFDGGRGDDHLQVRSLRQQPAQIAEEMDCDVETDMLQAREIGPALVDEAIERGVDLITIGFTYKKQYGEFTLGETIPYVLKNAPCWVLICREPISEEED